MARIRTIKPEFWTSPDVVSVSLPARLAFIGTWNFADDWGLLLDDPARLRLQLFPADHTLDMAALLGELVEAGLLARLTAPNGDRLLSIPTWGNHQKIDSRTVGRWGNPADWQTSQPTTPDPTESRPVPPDPALGMESEVEGISHSSSDWGTTRPALDRLDHVAKAVVAVRLAAQTDIRNPQAWRKRAMANLRTEDDGGWWARLEQIVASHRDDTPIDLLAQAAEGNASPNLRHWRRDRAAA